MDGSVLESVYDGSQVGFPRGEQGRRLVWLGCLVPQRLRVSYTYERRVRERRIYWDSWVLRPRGMGLLRFGLNSGRTPRRVPRQEGSRLPRWDVWKSGVCDDKQRLPDPVLIYPTGVRTSSPRSTIPYLDVHSSLFRVNRGLRWEGCYLDGCPGDGNRDPGGDSDSGAGTTTSSERRRREE